jgi:coenzyme F420-reducing hydrogenase beta subunit
MSNMPKVLDLVVKNDLCIGCGLCTYKCVNNALAMGWDDNGFLVPRLIDTCNSDGSCIIVCPFNPFPEKDVQTEDELSEMFLKDATLTHSKVGRYHGIYTGYADEFRLSSSSGGLATFICCEILERGTVNHVFSVKESSISGAPYEYNISSSRKELLTASQTKYYPVTLSTVFSKINELDGKIAIVGVACFIKAIRLAQHYDSVLKEKIPFVVGIICGGVKSRFFTEYLAAKVDIPKNQFYKPEFRIKDLNSAASDYSFGCIDYKDNQKKTIKMSTVGDMWGTGLFKANACDFCDDVTTELADISVGDAWLQPFVNDSKGTNVIVTRSALADKIVREGIVLKNIYVKELSLGDFLSSQQGSFNHRHTGLAYRISQTLKKNQLVPPKRFNNVTTLSFYFKVVQFFRRKVRSKSLYFWRAFGKIELFDKEMTRYLIALKIVTRLYHYKRFLVKLLTRSKT